MTATPTRRQLLSAAALLPVAACTSSEDRPERPDPDDALRDAAVARERALLALYDAVPAALRARVAGPRADHEAHLAVLLGATATATASAGPSAAPAAPTGLPALVAAERAAAAAHATDAVTASPDLAVLLASLAASEASHPVALA